MAGPLLIQLVQGHRQRRFGISQQYGGVLVRTARQDLTDQPGKCLLRQSFAVACAVLAHRLPLAPFACFPAEAGTAPVRPGIAFMPIAQRCR